MSGIDTHADVASELFTLERAALTALEGGSSFSSGRRAGVGAPLLKRHGGSGIDCQIPLRGGPHRDEVSTHGTKIIVVHNVP